jgi:hypothetical protein
MLRDALFHAQHLDIGTAVMDLNHVRVMPATKPSPTTLRRDLLSDSSANYCQLNGILGGLFVFIVYFYLSMVLETGLKGSQFTQESSREIRHRANSDEKTSS